MPPRSTFLGDLQLLDTVDPLWSEACELSRRGVGFDPRVYACASRDVLAGLYPIARSVQPHSHQDLPARQGAHKAMKAKLAATGAENLTRRSNFWEVHYPSSSHCNSATTGRNSAGTLTSIAASLDSSTRPKLPEHNADEAGRSHMYSAHSYAEEISAVQAHGNTPYSEMTKGGMQAAIARFKATEVIGRENGFSGFMSGGRADPESEAAFLSKELFYITDFGRNTLQRLALLVDPIQKIFFNILESSRAATGLAALLYAITSAKAKDGEKTVGLTLESLGLTAHSESDLAHSRLFHATLRLGAGGYDSSQRTMLKMLQACCEDGPVLV